MVLAMNRRSAKGGLGLSLVTLGLVLIVNSVMDWVEDNYYYGQ